MFHHSKTRPDLRLPDLQRLLVGSALIGVTALGFSAPEAKAVTVCNFNNLLGCINKTATVGDKELTTLFGPSIGSGKVDFTQDNGFWQVDVDFDPLQGFGVGEFEYTLKILDPAASFDKVVNQWAGSGANVTKLVYSDPFETLIAELTADGQEATLPTGIQQIWVVDFYSVSEQGELDSFQNLYTQTTVPGPLPLLGAGTAFGFSRRLRRRLKRRHSLG